MAGSSDNGGGAAAFGVFMGIIGALAGYKANGGGGALAGGIAGFLFGMAVVKFIVVALIFAVSALGLYLAWNRLIAVTNGGRERTESSAPAPGLPDASTARQIRFVSTCRRGVRLFIKWQKPNGEWWFGGPFDLGPFANSFLSEESGAMIRSNSPHVFYYAHIPDTDYRWSGPNYETFNGQSLPMRRVRFHGNAGDELRIDCDSFRGM